MRFKGRYRISSVRLSGWDYRGAGVYCVTICTQNRIPWLGRVVNDRVELSDIGRIVEREWQRVPRARPSLTLDEWIIMPDHLHGILVFGHVPGDGERGVGRLTAHSLGAVVGHFKSGVTKHVWGKGYRDFAWQERYFDQIVRDERSLHELRLYIRNNPLRWKEKHPSGER
jgi:putative transposase